MIVNHIFRAVDKRDVTPMRRCQKLSHPDLLVDHKGLTREQAHAVAAVAVDLRIGQIVDVPDVIVSAVLPLDIFTK